jgi:hypothetical protein
MAATVGLGRAWKSTAKSRDRAAQHLIHGHVHHLAAYVPERLVDARDGRSQHRSAAVEAAEIHELVEMLHLHGIAADDEILEVQHASHGRGRLAFERCLAPARHALIGLDLDEDVRAVGLRDPFIQSDAEDLHIGDAQFRSGIAKRRGAGRLIGGGRHLRRAAAILERVRAPATIGRGAQGARSGESGQQLSSLQ